MKMLNLNVCALEPRQLLASFAVDSDICKEVRIPEKACSSFSSVEYVKNGEKVADVTFTKEQHEAACNSLIYFTAVKAGKIVVSPAVNISGIIYDATTMSELDTETNFLHAPVNLTVTAASVQEQNCEGNLIADVFAPKLIDIIQASLTEKSEFPAAAEDTRPICKKATLRAHRAYPDQIKLDHCRIA
jgi:hypothetical protein